MGCCRKTCTVTLAIIAAVIGYAAHSLYEVPPVPELDQNQYWGPGKAPKTLDTSIRPFKVEFKPERIEDLKQKLSESEWYTEPLEGIGFQYGFNGKYLREVVGFWKNKYDFVERQNYLNKYPQFKTNIQGLDIHYIHIKQTPAKGSTVVPILLLHGWPGSFVEFFDVISILTTQKNSKHAFELIVPSLPGYGYSQGASKPGLGPAQIAVVMKNLMKRLGYSKYSIQGGDWGALITNAMAVMYPDEIYGFHTNLEFDDSPLGTLKLLVGSLYPPMFMEKEHISKVYPLTEYYQYLLEEAGYLHIQATKPDTIGAGLMSSPVGLAAYIMEKFSTWTNKEWKSLPDGGLTKKYTLTKLLDNIMVYWDSKCITTSMRLYAEAFNKEHSKLKISQIPVTVPSAVARFAHELAFPPKCSLKGKYKNLVQVSDFEDGGHFAAFEQPEHLAKDLISAVTAFEEFYKNKETQEKNNKK